jgi:hypothetical protein
MKLYMKTRRQIVKFPTRSVGALVHKSTIENTSDSTSFEAIPKNNYRKQTECK